MDSDWATIAACASAFAATSALAISLFQMRQSNGQALFSRRLNIWLTTEKLMNVYSENAEHLKPGDGAQLANDLCFLWLTNTTSLQEIGPAISNVLDGEWQLKLHLKLDEIRSQASEARYIFKGNSGLAISCFLDAYQELLFKMYQYQILASKILDMAQEHRLSLEETCAGVYEKGYREELFAAQDALSAAYQELSTRKIRGKIKRQMRLVSTPKDIVDTFLN